MGYGPGNKQAEEWQQCRKSSERFRETFRRQTHSAQLLMRDRKGKDKVPNPPGKPQGLAYCWEVVAPLTKPGRRKMPRPALDVLGRQRGRARRSLGENSVISENQHTVMDALSTVSGEVL